VTKSEFIEDISGCCGEIGYCVLTKNETLGRRLVNDTTDCLIVGADWFETGLFEGRGDQVVVDCVKIYSSS
jgi:hypothetical protein